MLGYDGPSFWDQTERTLAIAFDAHTERMIQQHNNQAWHTWHGAALGREKRMTPLQKLRITRAQIDPNRAMHAQIDGLVRWVRATGGKVIYNG